MLKTQYDKGCAAALARFKVANLTAGAQAYNPTLNGQANGTHNALTSPPTTPAAPMATGSAKAQVLG